MLKTPIDKAFVLVYTRSWWFKVEESGVFYGEYLHTIDKKNRLIVPAKFREGVGDSGTEKFYITRGLDACLFMFAENEWKVQEGKFKTMPFTKRDTRRFNRLFFSGAVEAIPDKQWRILIPDYLKEYAGLTEKVMIIGVSNRVEIWDKDKWDEFYNSSKQDYEDIAEGLIDL
jgi:MraZ protein